MCYNSLCNFFVKGVSMANKYQALSGDISELESGMRFSKDKDEFRRFQAVFLRIAQALSVEEISLITCFSASWVRQLHSLYRRNGAAALLSSPKGGRYHENMSQAEEDAFICRC